MSSFCSRTAHRVDADRALMAQLSLMGTKVALMEWHSQKPWQSITFAGIRHDFRFAFKGAQAVEIAEQFIINLPDHQFNLPNHLVADAAVVEVDHQVDPPLLRLTFEMLLLDER